MNNNTGKHTYLTYGIPIGLVGGAAVAILASLNIGICAGVGMLAGIVIGAFVDEQKSNSSNE